MLFRHIRISTRVCVYVTIRPHRPLVDLRTGKQVFRARPSHSRFANNSRRNARRSRTQNRGVAMRAQKKEHAEERRRRSSETLLRKKKKKDSESAAMSTPWRRECSAKPEEEGRPDPYRTRCKSASSALDFTQDPARDSRGF